MKSRSNTLSTRPARISTRDTRALQPSARTVDPLYSSAEWKSLVKQLIKARGRRCQVPTCRRALDRYGKPIRIFGDHITELRDGGEPLDPGNVQLLCGSCHTTKTTAARAARMAETF